MVDVFLGGTCNETTWREDLIALLDSDVSYFNPVVDDWNEECKQKEIEMRNTSKYVLYVITPKMTGVYSIAELIDDSNKRPTKTLFYIQEKDVVDGVNIVFNKQVSNSLASVKDMAIANGAKCFTSLQAIADFLNGE